MFAQTKKEDYIPNLLFYTKLGKKINPCPIFRLKPLISFSLLPFLLQVPCARLRLTCVRGSHACSSVSVWKVGKLVGPWLMNFGVQRYTFLWYLESSRSFFIKNFYRITKRFTPLKVPDVILMTYSPGSRHVSFISKDD
jgi:hypothetical protein